jgi:hypothetical protein
MARSKDFSEARYGSIKRFQRGYPCLELKDFSEALLVPTSTYPLEFLKKFTSQKLTYSVCVCVFNSTDNNESHKQHTHKTNRSKSGFRLGLDRRPGGVR